MLPWQRSLGVFDILHELIVTVQRAVQRAAKAVNIWLQTGDLEHASRPHQIHQLRIGGPDSASGWTRQGWPDFLEVLIYGSSMILCGIWWKQCPGPLFTARNDQFEDLDFITILSSPYKTVSIELPKGRPGPFIFPIFQLSVDEVQPGT